MKIKVIKTKNEYVEALKLIEFLMDKNPDSDSEDGEKLSLLITLVKDYESNEYPRSLPDPLDAILFRMEQQNLKPRDLIPYIGSSSKVSEVLSRKRPLTLSMMRSLEAGLGIPAKVLLKEPDPFRDDGLLLDRLPIREMEKRNYFGGALPRESEKTVKIIKDFLSVLGSPEKAVGLLRRSYYTRSIRPVNKFSLMAWSARVVSKAKAIEDNKEFAKNSLNMEFLKNLAQLSTGKDGPIKVGKFLGEYGITVVVEPCFPQTYVDGATLMFDKKHPIIGLTIRHDRLDNFWFTLFHELAHLSLHIDQGVPSFYDDLDAEMSESDFEKEADKLASEALIPESKWANSPARIIPSPVAAYSFAKELGIHVAIVAGKMRKTNERYRYLNSLVGQGEVKKLFTEVDWS